MGGLSQVTQVTASPWTSLTSSARGYSELGATDELHHAMPCKQDKNPEYHFSLDRGVGPARIISLFSPWTHCAGFVNARGMNCQKMRGWKLLRNVQCRLSSYFQTQAPKASRIRPKVRAMSNPPVHRCDNWTEEDVPCRHLKFGRRRRVLHHNPEPRPMASRATGQTSSLRLDTHVVRAISAPGESDPGSDDGTV